MSLRNQLADHIASLNPEEFSQLRDLSDYLGEKAGRGNPSGRMAEGSIATLLNRQPPRIRQAMKMLNEVIESPREMPFQDKLSESQILDKLGLDHEAGATVKAALDYADVQQGVMSRMGTDSDRPEEPPSTRDIISAAIDFHAGAE